MLISSRRNPLVRQLRQLHDGSGRRDQGLLLLEGTHLLQELLRLGLRPRHLLVTEDWQRNHAHLLAALPPGCQSQLVSPEVLEAVATTRHPDGVVATVEPPPWGRAVNDGGDPRAGVRAEDFWLVLDTVQDPGNLGTLIRTALAAGVGALWLANGADPFQPKVLRASAGAALALPIWRDGRTELAAALARLRQRPGIQVLASVPPDQGATPYWQCDWTRPTVLLLGSEGSGLHPELQTMASQLVTVPHLSAVESLNVAVAAAPLLLERQRQRLAAVAGQG